MDLITIRFIAGALFILLALAGQVKIKEVKVGIINKHLRISCFVIGVIFILFDFSEKSVFPENVEIHSSKVIDIKDWQGKWKIGWGCSNNFGKPEPVIDEIEMIFTIVKENKLHGVYESTYNGDATKCRGRKAKTELDMEKMERNGIIGTYMGKFIDTQEDYESGEIELYLFDNKRFFCGRYLRRKPNPCMATDGNYRFWYGKKI